MSFVWPLFLTNLHRKGGDPRLLEYVEMPYPGFSTHDEKRQLDMQRLLDEVRRQMEQQLPGSTVFVAAPIHALDPHPELIRLNQQQRKAVSEITGMVPVRD
jgi:hypothetical protein